MSSKHAILIIDDDPNLCRTLALILTRAGYRVTTATHAYEALQYLQADAYDLVFLDLKMPDIDGLTLLPEIHRCYPEMPVLILTAYATPESTVEAIRRGARDYLSKPIDPGHILACVYAILAEV